jgi:adenylate cyclase
MSIHGSVTQRSPSNGLEDISLEHAVRRHLEALLQSEHFDASSRSREFLAYVVEEVLAGRDSDLSQASIAIAVFGRRPDFDAIIDPIVRVQAGRLRRSLERYYLLTGDGDALRIELPKGSYAPVFRQKTAGNGAGRSAARRLRPADGESAWPALLVHRLSSSSPPDGELAMQADDELTRELCRHGDVRVVREDDARATERPPAASLRFELLGTLRRVEDRRLIGVRLMDRAHGQQIWSDEYDGGPTADGWTPRLADIFRVIAARTGAEHGVIHRLLAGEHASGRRYEADDCSAVAAYHHVLFSRDVTELAPVLEALQHVIVRAPEIATGWTYLARLYLMNHSFELSALHTPISQTLKYASQAVLLVPDNARARCVLAETLLVIGELGAARDELEQGLRLNLHSLAHLETIGWLMALAGDWQGGMRVLHEARERNPYCLPHVSHALWADHLRRGEIEAAHVAALGYRDSGFFWRDLMIACCLGHLGRSSEAHASVAELLQAKPQFPQRGHTLIGHYIKSPELRETVTEGLRKAGLELTS